MRRKIERFADNAARRNVIQPGKEFYESIKGKWHSDFFENTNDIFLELACGRGEYSVGMAIVYPQRNFIGVDIKGDRIWKGSNQAVNENLQNVAFLRTNILNLERFFEVPEVAEIWILFPDPRPKGRDERRRITAPRFLEIYKSIICPGGTIRLKTDNTDFFEFTLETLRARTDIKDLELTRDLYNSPMNAEHHGIRTRYEEKFNEAGHDIKYLKFQFKIDEM